jgi:hypothetical protein
MSTVPGAVRLSLPPSNAPRAPSPPNKGDSAVGCRVFSR